MFPDPAARGLIASVPFSEENIVDAAEVNQWHWIEEIVQLFENVDQTHLVQASGKLVLQIRMRNQIIKSPPTFPSSLELPLLHS